MRRALALMVGLVAGLLLLAPARLLLPAPPLAATSVNGTIWHPQLAGAAIGGARLGDVSLALQPALLLKGRLGWQASGAASGLVWHSLAGGGATALSGTLTGLALPGVARLTLSGVDLALDGRGRCQVATGQVQVQLATALAGQGGLSGAPRCQAGALLLPLASSDGRVRLDATLGPQGWSARLAVSGAGPSETAALAAAGLRAQNGAMVNESTGAW